MTRLGIVSDSHGRDVWLERFLEVCKRQKYDGVFHLGDCYSDARWLQRRLDAPVIAVAGNCDVFCDHQRMALASYGPHRLVAMHGHLQDVKYGYERLSYYAEAQNANIALFGHTHVPFAGWVGCVMAVNPGALMDGRYAELILDGDSAVPYLRSLKEDGKT